MYMTLDEAREYFARRRRNGRNYLYRIQAFIIDADLKKTHLAFCSKKCKVEKKAAFYLNKQDHHIAKCPFDRIGVESSEAYSHYNSGGNIDGFVTRDYSLSPYSNVVHITSESKSLLQDYRYPPPIPPTNPPSTPTT